MCWKGPKPRCTGDLGVSLSCASAFKVLFPAPSPELFRRRPSGSLVVVEETGRPGKARGICCCVAEAKGQGSGNPLT